MVSKFFRLKLVETDAQLNEEVKWTEFDEAFCKIFKILLDRFFHFLARRRKSAEKTTHRKKIGVTERPRSLNPRKVKVMAICPIILHFTT